MALAAACLALLALPGQAWACPSCAGRDDGGAAKLGFIGAMILFPFFVTAAVVPVIRRAGRPRSGESRS